MASTLYHSNHIYVFYYEKEEEKKNQPEPANLLCVCQAGKLEAGRRSLLLLCSLLILPETRQKEEHSGNAILCMWEKKAPNSDACPPSCENVW